MKTKNETATAEATTKPATSKPAKAERPRLVLNKSKSLDLDALNSSLNKARCIAGNIKADILKRKREDLLTEIHELTGDTSTAFDGRCISALFKEGFITRDQATLFRALAAFGKAAEALAKL